MPPGRSLEKARASDVWEAAVSINTLCVQQVMTGSVGSLGALSGFPLSRDLWELGIVGCRLNGVGAGLLVLTRVANLDSLFRGEWTVDCRDRRLSCTFIASAWLQQSLVNLHNYLRLNRAHDLTSHSVALFEVRMYS